MKPSTKRKIGYLYSEYFGKATFIAVVIFLFMVMIVEKRWEGLIFLSVLALIFTLYAVTEKWQKTPDDKQ